MVLSLIVRRKSVSVKPARKESIFPTGGGMRAEHILDLVHTDVCGKLNPRSEGGAEYFVTFVDDKSRYVWVCVSKSKSEVFSKFRDWKAMVERSTGRKLKVLWSDMAVSTRLENWTNISNLREFIMS